MELLFIYIKELYSMSRSRFLVNLLFMVILGMMEGIGILMIIPLLMVAGIIPGIQANSEWAVELNRLFQNMGMRLNLPLVLLVYTGINFGQSWLQRRQTMLNFDLQQEFSVLLSIRLFRVVAYAKWQLLIAKTKTDIANIIISELMRVYSGINVFLQMAAAAAITIIQISIAFMIAPGLTCSVLLGAFILSICLLTFLKKTRRMGQNITHLNSQLLSELTEHLQGIKDIKCNGIEADQIDSFIQTRSMMKKNLSGFIRLQTRADMCNKVGAAIFISLFLFSAIEIFHLNSQQLILISIISARLWPKLASLQMGILNLHAMLPAFRAVINLENQCVAAQEDIATDKGSSRIELKQGVEFRNVSFYYESEAKHYALVNADFILPAGTTTAFVGVSGSGKSTLADLLIGLLSPAKGSVLIDGELLSDHLGSWRNSIGYVPQDPFVLNASIRDNLLWACPDAAEEGIWEALRLAAMDTFVQSLPRGLDTVVGDRGVRLSGGERQRIVLARALLRKPSVLILDEATSSLDTENERRIQHAIEKLQGKLTIVIIAHRISTIRNADRILVLEQGQIVEQGNYQSLINNQDSRFRALVCAAAT